MTPWLMGLKYPKHITLCDTNTVILLIKVIIIDTYFLPISKKIKLDSAVAITRIAIILSFGV